MMSTVLRPKQRRRTILTCVECRKRKQKCDRGQPCAQCVARGPESICVYERFKSSSANVTIRASRSPHSLTETSPSTVETRSNDRSPESAALMQHAHDYGYSNTDSLNSMGMLTQVISGISPDIAHATPPRQIQSKIRAEYFGYVRRLPPTSSCEVLFQHFFAGINTIHLALDEIIFREQLFKWDTIGYDILLNKSPESLPEELLHFPALLFQLFAVALQYLPINHDSSLDRLKFCSTQTLFQLATEYSDCATALSSLLRNSKPSLVAVQYSILKDWWFTNNGELLQAWDHSGQSVRLAMALNLHIEPVLPSSSHPEELLQAVWMNELRKRVWLNLVAWDNAMAVYLGRPMFIDLRKCTVGLPCDCETPKDRVKSLPVRRSQTDKPTPLTERLLRFEITRRFREIRELESQGAVPETPNKVKELHQFAENFRRNLPPFFQSTNPDTQWDGLCPYVPIQRELLSYLVDSFLLALHRPYIFTRQESQNQVYHSALAILDSQDRMYKVARTSQIRMFIGVVFPTFDAAVLLAVVLVSNPERYHASFPRQYDSLQNALQRLTHVGEFMKLARTGAEILETTIRRVVDADRSIGETFVDNADASRKPFQSQSPPPATNEVNYATSSSVSPNSEPWNFDPNPAMEWTQNSDLVDFDFSNLEVPMPLKELLLDEDIAPSTTNSDAWDATSYWMPATQAYQQSVSHADMNPQGAVDVADNSLWNFLAGYENVREETAFQDPH